MRAAVACILFIFGAVTTANGPGGNQSFPQLRGVNRSGTEYQCIKGDGLFDGPSDNESIDRMKEWNINIVRVPLNEDCWLNRNINRAEYGGESYRNAIENWVRRLRRHGLYVIIDLHWTEGIYGGNGQGACYDQAARCQKPMPDLELAPEFWESVANTFKDDEGILFELFNEPFPDQVINWDLNQAWLCWQKGDSECPGFQYKVAGMEHLVNAVRKTGANNMLVLGGLRWANELEAWLDHMPYDPKNNLAAAAHLYSFNDCNYQECWDRGVGKISAAGIPVIATEIGQDDCNHWYIDKLMPYLDQKNIHYIAWAWNNWDCGGGPGLVTDYQGTPTNFGIGFKDHLKP